jgi:hypothetical protein
MSHWCLSKNFFNVKKFRHTKKSTDKIIKSLAYRQDETAYFTLWSLIFLVNKNAILMNKILQSSSASSLSSILRYLYSETSVYHSHICFYTSAKVYIHKQCIITLLHSNFFCCS